ncbi:MAG: SPASM domain-containing protein, partial [Desulfobacteraceae bacterium]|nr:SPASM domain-containing protein [Desulfobacteraceae bacterium]
MFMRFWKAQGARIFFHTVVNRAGTLKSFEQIEHQEAKTAKRLLHLVINRIFPFCLLPFFTLNVLWDGRVILCCHDWGPGVVLADLTKQSLSEVWNGEEMNYHRHLLFSGHSEKSPSCKNCSLKDGLWRVPTRFPRKSNRQTH